MFFVNKITSVLIFVFSCFSNLEQPGYDLLRAVETGDVGMVGRLFSLGVLPDLPSSDWFGRRPLHMAAIYNNTEIAQLLITHKAYIKARDEDNQNASSKGS